MDAKQPMPTPNGGALIVDLVIEDLRARDVAGRETYGAPLQAFNGRDPLLDAYEETLDKANYLKQELVERADYRAEGAAAEREKIVGYLRHRARELDGYDGEPVLDLAAAIEACAHHDTWPAPPPESDDDLDSNTATEEP